MRKKLILKMPDQAPMTDEQNKQHDYLLADFQATKAEIARRSNAQKTALAAMVVFYAWLLNQLVSTNFGLWHLGAIWIVTILGYVFYKREGVEIGRLGVLIRRNIAEVAAKDLNVSAENLLPSEVSAADDKYDCISKALDWIFSVSLFGLIPGALTVFYIFEGIYKRISTWSFGMGEANFATPFKHNARYFRHICILV